MSELPYPLPEREHERLRVLADYHLLDTPQTEDFERLVSLTARLFNAPIALISLVDRDRQFFKARVGLDVCETSREVSFCAHALVQDEILLVPDALEDPRFATNPLVLGPPFIRFYAGHPLVAASGEKLGTLCVIDRVPRRDFSDEDRRNLSDLAALVMDRVELHRLEYVKTVSQARFENIASTSPDAIICTNAEGSISFWNRSAGKLFGYSAEEMAQQPVSRIVPDRWRSLYEAEYERLRLGEPMALADKTIELSGRRKDGSEFPAELSLSTWHEGSSTSVGAIVRDVTERRRNEERLYRLASLDVLTDLSNRSAWQECLTIALEEGTPVTIMLLDLDHFKDVNDGHGHAAGDAVLREVAARLRATCTEASIVARLGGDEFAVLMPGDDVAKAQEIAERLIRVVSEPYAVAGQNVEIGASVGLALFPPDGRLPEELLNAADLALYRAKAAGRGRHEFFVHSYREVAVIRRAFERELRLAFENGEFELYYQPQVGLHSRHLCGAEALMRWRHPQRGLLTPSSFIDVLARKPSAGAVGEWVLRTACRQAVQWRTRAPGFRISVNLFDVQFRSARLLGAVRATLAETGLPADAVELELVENILLQNDEGTLRLLHSLREMGIGLAFDDYGTGFASLSLLKRYPVTRLKIDQSFVRGVTCDLEDAAIVKAVIYLANSFGLSVIAEGVETEEQLAFLDANGCGQAQGYLFGAPASAEDFAARYLDAHALGVR